MTRIHKTLRSRRDFPAGHLSYPQLSPPSLNQKARSLSIKSVPQVRSLYSVVARGPQVRTVLYMYCTVPPIYMQLYFPYCKHLVSFELAGQSSGVETERRTRFNNSQFLSYILFRDQGILLLHLSIHPFFLQVFLATLSVPSSSHTRLTAGSSTGSPACSSSPLPPDKWRWEMIICCGAHGMTPMDIQ